MTLYVRKYPCAICREPVYWDSEKQKLTCGCGTFKHTFVNLKVFTPVPKYDRRYWKSETFPIDSAKFLLNEFLLDGSQVLLISDRQSIFKGNENPRMTLRWIHYPKRDKIQLCMAVTGTFHTEKIAYQRKNPQNWKERMWIYIPPETIPKIIEFLERDPNKLASWM